MIEIRRIAFGPGWQADHNIFVVLPLFEQDFRGSRALSGLWPATIHEQQVVTILAGSSIRLDSHALYRYLGFDLRSRGGQPALKGRRFLLQSGVQASTH